LEKAGYKKIRCLNSTWFNSEKFNASNLYLANHC